MSRQDIQRRTIPPELGPVGERQMLPTPATLALSGWSERTHTGPFNGATRGRQTNEQGFLIKYATPLTMPNQVRNASNNAKPGTQRL